MLLSDIDKGLLVHGISRVFSNLAGNVTGTFEVDSFFTIGLPGEQMVKESRHIKTIDLVIALRGQLKEFVFTEQLQAVEQDELQVATSCSGFSCAPCSVAAWVSCW